MYVLLCCFPSYWLLRTILSASSILHLCSLSMCEHMLDDETIGMEDSERMNKTNDGHY